MRSRSPTAATAWADLGALRDQRELFGRVASHATAWRAIAAAGEGDRLDGLRAARARARSRGWQAGAAPEEIVLDFDSHLVTAHSDKEGAAPTWKGGYGFHPLLCYLDGSGEPLAGLLHEGSAGANTAADHVEVLALALEQIPAEHLDRPMLARSDSAGATHEFAAAPTSTASRRHGCSRRPTGEGRPNVQATSIDGTSNRTFSTAATSS